MTETFELSIRELGRQLRAGDVTSVELAQQALQRIETLDGEVNSFVLVTTERALEDAARADRDFSQGIDRGPLQGIPYALKDIFDTAGIRTSCHSKLRLSHVPLNDSEVHRRLQVGGAVLLGKLATHEFALGGPSFDLPFPPARNPWDIERFTGGSSSGCGAAVATGLVRVAFGSDTSGSIRTPACHCGIVGLKPTYGLVSRRGAFPLSYSLDHCGPMTWSVDDTALALQVVAGYDALDPASAQVEVRDYSTEIGRGIAGKRIGFLRDWLIGAPNGSTEVINCVENALSRLVSLGADIIEIEGPRLELFNACGRIIMTAEAYAIHEDEIKSRPFDYGRYTYQRIAPGASISAADLVQAQRLRRELTDATNGCLVGLDALVAATAVAPAPRLSDFSTDWSQGGLSHTIPFTVTGNPALAIPVGITTNGLPIGIQIVGHPFDEAEILGIGACLESSLGTTSRRPPLVK